MANKPRPQTRLCWSGSIQAEKEHKEATAKTGKAKTRARADLSPFHKRLRALGFKSYNSYLGSAHWREFRQRYMASGKEKCCVVCGAEEVVLHHLTYVRLGREKLDDVTPLCENHHDFVHQALRQYRWDVERSEEIICKLRNGEQVVLKPLSPSQNKRDRKRNARKIHRERSDDAVFSRHAKFLGMVFCSCPSCGKESWQVGTYCPLCGKKGVVPI